MRPPNTSSRSTHAGQGRVVKNAYVNALSDELKVEAVLATATLWELAALVPEKKLGAPRKLPVIFYLSMLGLASVWGSFRDAQGQLNGRGNGNSIMWEHLCRMAVQYQQVHRPHDEPFDLDSLLATPALTAQNFFDARRSWLAPFMDNLQGVFEAVNLDVAREMGFADPDGEGSINNLVRERMATGDGKVVREVGTRYALLSDSQVAAHNEGKPRGHRISADSHVIDRHNGEIIPIALMDGEQLYHTGGGLKIGHKFIAWSIRDDSANSSVIMSVRRQRTKDEAAEMTAGAIDLKKQLPGLLGAITDAALRGTHNCQLMRAGLVPINPIAAKRVEGTNRVEKSGLYEVLSHDHPQGRTCEHRIYYYAGGMAEWRPNEAGEQELIDFGSPRIRERRDKSGSRMYAEFQIICREGLEPDELGLHLGVVRVNVTTPPTGAKNELNIPENIRLVPPGRPTYKRVYGWRNNAENDNRQRDHRKFLARARSRGAERQHWNEIGSGMVQNGVALLLSRARTSQQAAAHPAQSLQAA